VNTRSGSGADLQPCLRSFKSLRRQLLSTLLAACALSAACGRQPEPPPREVSIWHQVGAWSGRGNKQTETFTSDTGAFRVTWETRNESPPGAGTLYAVFRSGDSGREIMDGVKVTGVGRGVEHVAAERPRWYYLSIDSANVDWSITVDEEIPGQVPPKP
jgi:hypothetical protein